MSTDGRIELNCFDSQVRGYATAIKYASWEPGPMRTQRQVRFVACVPMNFKFEHIIIKLIRFNFLESVSYTHTQIRFLSLALSLWCTTYLSHTLSFTLSISTLLVLTFNFLHMQSNQFEPKWTATAPLCVCASVNACTCCTCLITDCKLNIICIWYVVVMLFCVFRPRRHRTMCNNFAGINWQG